MSKLEKIGLRVFVWLSIILGFLEFGFWKPAHCAENTVTLIAEGYSITVPESVYNDVPSVVAFYDYQYRQWWFLFGNITSISTNTGYDDRNAQVYSSGRITIYSSSTSSWETTLSSRYSLSPYRVFVFKGPVSDIDNSIVFQGLLGGQYDDSIPSVVLTPRDGNISFDITYPENYDSDRYSVAINLDAYAPNPSDIFLDGFNDYPNAAIINYVSRLQRFFMLGAPGSSQTDVSAYFKDRRPWDLNLFIAWDNALDDIVLTRTLTYESETNEPIWDMSTFISLKIDEFTPYFSNIMGSANGLYLAFYTIRPKRIVATVIDNNTGNRGSSYVITFDQQGHILANGLFGNNQSADFDNLISGAKDDTINELNRQIRELQVEIEYLNYVNENFAGVSTDADIGKTFTSTVTGLIDTFKSLPQIGRIITTGLDFIPLDIRNVIYFGIFAIVIISLYKALRG